MTIKTILNNACNEDEPESVARDQALQWGEKAKTGSNRKNIGERSEPSGILSPFQTTSRLASHTDFFYAHTDFFYFFPRCGPGPRLQKVRRYGSLTFNFHGDSSRPFQEENWPQENYFL